MTMKGKCNNQGAVHGSPVPDECNSEASAYELLELLRWQGAAKCPRCGGLNVYQMQGDSALARQANFRWLCRDCRKQKRTCQFTVRTGTVFEDSKVELRHWCYAFWRASTFDSGVTALEIHQHTGLSYKSSLFILHRIRYAIDSTVENSAAGSIGARRDSGERLLIGSDKEGAKKRKYSSTIVAKATDKKAVLEVSWLILNFFIEHKSSSFTVRQMAEVSGVSERTFYRYFPRKEDVVRPVFAANARSLVDSFSARDHSESIENSLVAAFDQSWWANHPEQARVIRYIMYESSELRAVWLQVIIDIEIILSEALAVRLGIAPESRRAALAAAVVTAAIRNAFSDFSDAAPDETLTQSFARNIGVLGSEIFKL